MTDMKRNSVILLVTCAVCLLPFVAVDVFGQTAEKQETAVTDSAAAADEDTLLTFTLPSYRYQSSGKRDPFESLAPREISNEEEEERNKIKDLFSYEEASVLGIVDSASDSYALVSDKNELSYVLRVGDRVFGGYVTDITEDAVQLHIVKYGRSMRIILRMEASKFTVIEETEAETHITKPGINVSYKPGKNTTGEISIEEVIVTDPYVRTIEDEWFGGKKELPMLDEGEETKKTQISADSFSLIEPQDNAWIRLPYNLDWTNAPGLNNVYSVLIDDDDDFSSPLVMREGITASSFVISDNLNLPLNTGLFWKVIAYDKSGARVEPVQRQMRFQISGQ